MTKFLNKPNDVAHETLEGYLAVHDDKFVRIPGRLGFARRELPDKVAIVSGGGSGHEPVWLEYAGRGLADAIVQGDVFAAPPPPAIVDAARAVERGRGMLFIYGNYSGDALNFDLAAEELEAEGVEVRTVRITDDVASAGKSERHLRRGVAGGYFTAKVAGAAAELGWDLARVAEVAQTTNENTGSIAVASAPGTIPGRTESTFELPDGMLEIGMGMHGEPGVRRGLMETADALVDQMWQLLVDDLSLGRGDRAALLINSLGATTRAELYIVARRLMRQVRDSGLTAVDVQVGAYATCQEMHGFSLSVCRLNDTLEQLYLEPSDASFVVGASR
jgi:phosphoenolpyruvate---glycerone phosphotransferase subunit DhaK